MGNSVKSRLHLHKKSERPSPDEHDSPVMDNTRPARSEVDNQIMSGPNRARQMDAKPSDNIKAPATSRDSDPVQASTTKRARP